ncbi:MAG: sigma-70 family RNA polymerase sigma factor [Brooklawnia sp.]|jgi:RNA polymerase sigma factor (sigma-70 family)
MAVPDGYRELVEGQTPALFRRALLLSRDWHLAEDLVQETAVTALMKWRQVKAADDKPAYLQTVLTNHFLSRARKRSYQERPVEVEIEVPETVDPWPGIDLELQVANGLAALNPSERAVVVGRYMDDLPVAEVARQLDRKESWVRVTAHRALAKLRDEMTDEAGTPQPSRAEQDSADAPAPAQQPRRVAKEVDR